MRTNEYPYKRSLEQLWNSSYEKSSYPFQLTSAILSHLPTGGDELCSCNCHVAKVTKHFTIDSLNIIWLTSSYVVFFLKFIDHQLINKNKSVEFPFSVEKLCWKRIISYKLQLINFCHTIVWIQKDFWKTMIRNIFKKGLRVQVFQLANVTCKVK